MNVITCETFIVAIVAHLFCLQRLRVTQYEENFQSRVDEVDERYKERIHHLMSENSELRLVKGNG